MTKLQSYSQLYERYSALINSETLELVDLCRVASELNQYGFEEEFKKCFDIALNGMLGLIKCNYINDALVCENLLYATFVKVIESEEHYYSCFRRWSESFKQAGRSASSVLSNSPLSVNNKFCFIMQTGALLGHTAVMLRVIDSWRQLSIDVEVYVAILGQLTFDFKTQLESRGIKIIQPIDAVSAKPLQAGDAIKALRTMLLNESVSTIIWLSVPTYASYALAYKLAPKQIFWSLKLHPVFIEEADLHICGGHLLEESRVYNGQTWHVCPFPLTVSHEDVNKGDIQRIRSIFPHGAILLGTLAREEKYSLEFITSVCLILARNPNCYFVWTGRNQPDFVKQQFVLYGVEVQTHFVGWVDTNLYASAIDIFLETFPFGCGVTSFQAMGHAKPTVSYLADDTMFGYQLKGSLDSLKLTQFEAEKLAITTALDPIHYVDIVQKLIDDPALRVEYGLKAQRYFETESNSANKYAEKFYHLISNH